MWPLVAYSNCFEIVSTVAVALTRLILGMFVYSTVHYTLYIMIILYKV